MRALPFLIAFVSICIPLNAHAQWNAKGQIVFTTRVGPLLDAPVFLPDGRGAAFWPGMVAQLFIVSGSDLIAVEPPTTFRSVIPPAAAAYVEPKDVIFPDIPPGTALTFVLRAWDSTAGTTYEESRDAGGFCGESEPVTTVLGGGMEPPKNLIGLRGFTLRRYLRFGGEAIDGEGFKVHVNGADLHAYQIESSNDLIHWVPLGGPQVTAENEIHLPVEPGLHFFRAMLLN